MKKNEEILLIAGLPNLAPNRHLGIIFNLSLQHGVAAGQNLARESDRIRPLRRLRIWIRPPPPTKKPDLGPSLDLNFESGHYLKNRIPIRLENCNKFFSLEILQSSDLRQIGISVYVSIVVVHKNYHILI